MSFDFASCGGRAITFPTATMGIINTGDAWNFGLLPENKKFSALHAAKPTFHEACPQLIGKWDGKATVNHWLAAERVLGAAAEDLIQYQVRGTCGGRAGSAAGDLVQCIMIASGQWPLDSFARTSHAAVYFLARKFGEMLDGNWRDDNTDGVATGSVPEALKRISGFVKRDEISDANWYGAGSDDLACQLGAGMLPDVAEKILDVGADNKIDWFRVRSANELADGIAAGGIGLGCDSIGFSMQRDSRGFCRAQGRWDHYHVRCSVGVYGGTKGFGYFQSWGKGTPSGPLLDGHPSNCFGVTFADQERQIRNGHWVIVTGFSPFTPLDSFNFDWIF